MGTITFTFQGSDLGSVSRVKTFTGDETARIVGYFQTKYAAILTPEMSLPEVLRALVNKWADDTTAEVLAEVWRSEQTAAAESASAAVQRIEPLE